MNNYSRFFFTAIMILTAFAAAKATAPANDSFTEAMPLVLSDGSVGVVTNNVGAGKETGEPNHAENAGGKSVWFKYTPSVTTAVRINTTETTFDTLLAVYTGANVDNLTLVGFNDDCHSNCQGASTVDLMVTAGVTYYIAVDSYNNDGVVGEGSFKLVILDNGVPFNDTFGGAYYLGTSFRGTIAGTNYNATLDAGEPSGHINNPNGKSVWYRWTPQYDHSAAFELTENFDSQIAVYASNVPNPTVSQLNTVRTNYDGVHFSNSRYRVTFFAEAGKTYYIRIDWHTFNNSQFPVGNFQLRFFPNRLRYSANFNSTRQTSLMLYRPSEGVWYGISTVNGSAFYRKWGLNGDTPIAADFNGDGNSETWTVRNENNLKVWYVNYGGATSTTIQWGLASDKITTGDYDFDGRADLVAIRSNGQNLVWYVRQSANGALRTFVFGLPFDKPVMGDFDGDGGTDLAVLRNTQQGWEWHILKSRDGSYDRYTSFHFGAAPDKPAIDDYDGDGKSDPALFRQSNGTWYVQRSSTDQLQATPFGAAGDVPQPGDYDGDGKSELAVYRPSEGKWYFWFSGTDTQQIVNWGLPTDVPVSSLNTLVQ